MAARRSARKTAGATDDAAKSRKSGKADESERKPDSPIDVGNPTYKPSHAEVNSPDRARER